MAHYSCRCAVCGLDLAERYGEAARGLIHVHHLVPIAEIGSDYSVDPIADLRPVCPNCHAVIHRREPPYEPGDVAMMLRTTFRSAPTTTSTRGP
ncbi:MAG TPA: HNH endonuclease [Longimicrobiaceae bacterium]|nr:HNH endonuclease [Longimicrobiaceae bacterium]